MRAEPGGAACPLRYTPLGGTRYTVHRDAVLLGTVERIGRRQWGALAPDRSYGGVCATRAAAGELLAVWRSFAGLDDAGAPDATNVRGK